MLVLLVSKKLQWIQKMYETHENNSLQSQFKIPRKSFHSKQYCWIVIHILLRWDQDWRGNFYDWYLVLHWLSWWIIGIVLGILFLHIPVIWCWQTFWILLQTPLNRSFDVKIQWNIFFWHFVFAVFEHDLKYNDSICSNHR